MKSFCTAKATHIFSAKKIQLICVSLDVHFNESLTNDVVSFEQHGPGIVCSLCYFVRLAAVLFIPRHTIVSGYYGWTSVCLSVLTSRDLWGKKIEHFAT